MKDLLIYIMFMGISLLAEAQQSGLSEAMKKYQNGCLKISEAVAERDKYDLYEAKEWFGKVKLSTWQNVVSTDTGVSESDKIPFVYYNMDFADSLLRNNFDFVPLDDVSLMRNIEDAFDADLLVMHKAVPGNSMLEFKAVGSGHCEMMLFSSQGSGLKLTVEDTTTGKKYEGNSDKDGKVSWVVWDMVDYDGVFLFRVENLSKQKVSFVIAVN